VLAFFCNLSRFFFKNAVYAHDISNQFSLVYETHAGRRATEFVRRVVRFSSIVFAVAVSQ
jgi:hypothetical protein